MFSHGAFLWFAVFGESGDGSTQRMQRHNVRLCKNGSSFFENCQMFPTPPPRERFGDQSPPRGGATGFFTFDAAFFHYSVSVGLALPYD